MKYQFSSAVVPPRAGWFKVHYAPVFDGEEGRSERRYFDGDKWRVGAYPNHCEKEAKAFTRDPKNSWSYWFKKD